MFRKYWGRDNYMTGYINKQSYNMSTVTEQKIEEGEFSQKAAEEVCQLLIDIEKKMSFYINNSEISKINQNAGLSMVKVSDETLRVIRKSIEYSVMTKGKFDITLGPLISSWGVFSNHERILREDEVESLLELVQYKDIIIEGNYVGLKRKNQKIDLGGIAKGYATNEALRIYKKYNIKSAMINIGGNVVVVGRKNENQLWCVGIQNPEKSRNEYLGILQCEDTSVITSGNYVRYFKDGDKKYGHIIDCCNGFPSESDLTSVTILCNDGIKADALSTAVFSMGYTKGREMIKSLNDISAVLVTNDKKVYISSELKNYFYKTDEKNYEYLYF